MAGDGGCVRVVRPLLARPGSGWTTGPGVATVAVRVAAGGLATHHYTASGHFTWSTYISLSLRMDLFNDR